MSCLHRLTVLALAILVASSAAHRAYADNEGEQGGVVAGLAGDPNAPLSPCDGPPEEGRPVYLDTGELALLPYELTTPDPVIPVRGFTLDLRRTYRSGYAYPGVLGFGWDIASNRRLRRLNDGDIIVTTGTCRTAEYTFNGSGWDAPPGYARTLIQNANGSYTETARNGMEHIFDANGNLMEKRDRHGNRLAFAHSEDRLPILGRSELFVDSTPRIVALEHKLLRILDPTDREIVFTYNAQGQIETITDWLGRVWTYGYDVSGNLTSVTSPPTAQYPTGTTTTYAYTDARFPHKLKRVVPPTGQATGTASIENVYDDEGRVIRQDDGAGGTHLFSYEPDQTVVTDPNGTTLIYTSEDRQVASQTVVTRGVRPAEVEPAGTEYTTTYAYTDDLRTRTVYPEGNALELVYDLSNPNPLARSNLLEVRHLPKPGSSEPPLVTRYTYKTPFQQIGTIEDPLGNVTEYFYDASHNLERIEHPTVPEGSPIEYVAINALGQVTSYTDPNGNITTAEYDANGYLDRITRAAGTALAATTELDPDAVGRPTVVRDANGHETQLDFDAWNRLERQVAPAPFLYETTFSYNANGNLVQVDRDSPNPSDPQTTTFTYNVLDWPMSVANELGETTTYGYDPNGNRTSITDPESHVVARVFDERDLLYSETAANGDQVRLHYHPNARLSAVVDGNGNETLYGYDDHDRQALITHEDSTTEGRTHDAASRMIASTTRAGASFTYTYDDLHRLRSRTTPEETATFTYDLGGRMTAAASPAASLAFAYNARSQLTTETTTIPGLPALTVTHAYDGVGNRSQITYPDAGYVTYGYDALDRLELLQDNGTATLSQWTWDVLSRPQTRALPSGVSSLWTYDEASRVATITHSSSSGPLDARTYGRDPTGTITSLTDGLGTHTYGYDASKQMTSVDYPAASPFTDTTWTYDDAGNRLTETAGSTSTYVPNALNQYASVGGTTQVYDTNGNLVDDGTNTYTFDSQSRLVSALADDGLGGTISASYAYDPFMRRTRKTVDGAATYFLWSGGGLIEEYAGAGSRQKQYVYAADFSPAHVRSDDALGAEVVFDVHTGHLSAPILVTSSNGEAAWRAEYAGFAAAIVDPESVLGFDMRLPGQYFDDETGLQYNWFRYYDPSKGRYSGADPIGQIGSINLYRYAMNSVLHFIDPTGLSEVVFDRSDGTLTVYPGDGQGGRAQGPPQQFPASNNVSLANQGTDPYLPLGEGPAPDGTFSAEPLVPTGSDPGSALGDKGFIPLDLRPLGPDGEPQNRTEGGGTIGPGRGGVGIHAGRVGVCDGAGRCGSSHATNGCIRTTPVGMDALAADAPTKVTVQP
jgi:RHS repeat-associated protein